jgi:hypothetical protein
MTGNQISERRIVGLTRQTGYVNYGDTGTGRLWSAGPLARGGGSTNVSIYVNAYPYSSPIVFNEMYEPGETVIRSPEEMGTEMKLIQDLGELHDLAPGWLDGDGVAISRLAIEKAQRILTFLLIEDKPLPYPVIVPTPEGGMQAEWSGRDFESSITFEPDGEVHAFMMNMITHEVAEGTLEAGQGASEATHAA